MTSGTTGTPFTLAPFGTERNYRSWIGEDGKFESTSSGQRTKWNDYLVRHAAVYSSPDHVTLYWWLLTDPSNNGTSAVYEGFNVPSDDWNRIGDDTKVRLLSRISEKVRGHDFKLGVELGQLGQTVDLLSTNLQKLGRAALSLKRGNFSDAARQLGARPRHTRLKASDVSGRWLELQYGWLPLLSSSFNAAKAFEALSNGPRRSLFHSTIKYTGNWNAGTSDFDAIVKYQNSMRIAYELSEEMDATRQLGLTDPLSIAWELTPWSFVIDWFIPIGTYLDNLYIIPHLKGRWVVSERLLIPVTRVKVKWTNEQFYGPSWGVSIRPDIPTGGLTYFRQIRDSSNLPPSVPPPRFDFNGVNSVRRFWNAASLAHQRVTSDQLSPQQLATRVRRSFRDQRGKYFSRL